MMLTTDSGHAVDAIAFGVDLQRWPDALGEAGAAGLPARRQRVARQPQRAAAGGHLEAAGL